MKLSDDAGGETSRSENASYTLISSATVRNFCGVGRT